MTDAEYVRIHEKLDIYTFKKQFFNNKKSVSHRCYVLFELKRRGERRACFWGYAVNKPQSGTERGIHAEIFSIRKVEEYLRDNPGQFTINWYSSWSPCADCAEKILEWYNQELRGNGHTLKIWACKLYYEKNARNQIGLWNLRDNGVGLNVMVSEHYQCCRKIFIQSSHNQLNENRWLEKTLKRAEKRRSELSIMIQVKILHTTKSPAV
uniref:Cytosine deaminase n=1 Tax=Petromyzon marinus TaxID=7757 RepID=A5H718_PETMA|nr:cytosine deaminase [Petromyzon marinus]